MAAGHGLEVLQGQISMAQKAAAKMGLIVREANAAQSIVTHHLRTSYWKGGSTAEQTFARKQMQPDSEHQKAIKTLILVQADCPETTHIIASVRATITPMLYKAPNADGPAQLVKAVQVFDMIAAPAFRGKGQVQVLKPLGLHYLLLADDAPWRNEGVVCVWGASAINPDYYRPPAEFITWPSTTEWRLDDGALEALEAEARTYGDAVPEPEDIRIDQVARVAEDAMTARQADFAPGVSDKHRFRPLVTAACMAWQFRDRFLEILQLYHRDMTFVGARLGDVAAGAAYVLWEYDHTQAELWLYNIHATTRLEYVVLLRAACTLAKRLGFYRVLACEPDQLPAFVPALLALARPPVRAEPSPMQRHP